MMWEHCKDLLAARGHETVEGVRVERVLHKHGRVETVYGRMTDGRTERFGAEHFISTAPLRELIHSMDPPPPQKVIDAANRLRYRDYLTVVLIVKRESVFPDNWIYIHSPEVKMGRIQNYKNWSPDMMPDPTRTSLGLEYFLWEKDDEWEWSHERLIELGVKECARIGLVDPSEVEDGTVVRMKKAYPVYDQSYNESLAIVRNYLETFSNLQTVGRNGLHRYNNQDHSMLTAIYAARNITGESNDVWAVNTEMEYHEDGAAGKRVDGETVTQGKGKTARRSSNDNPQNAKPLSATGDRLTPSRVTARTMTPDEVIEVAFAKLDPVALGIAFGVASALTIFLASATLILRGGPHVGITLRLLSNFLIGFDITWMGAIIGAIETGIGAFALGFIIAWSRNWLLEAYAHLARRRAEARAQRDLLDKI